MYDFFFRITFLEMNNDVFLILFYSITSLFLSINYICFDICDFGQKCFVVIS